MEAGRWVPEQVVPSAGAAHQLPRLLPSVAVTRGMQCHLCKGFGGCSGHSNCPRNTTHCVIIATRECDGRDGLDTPFLHRDLAHWANRVQNPADQEHSRNMSGSLCLGQGPGRVFQCLGVALSTMADVIEVWAAQGFRTHRGYFALIPQGLPSVLQTCLW